MRLAAGFCTDLLGELEHSPDLLAAIGGGILLLREREKEGKGEIREGKREGIEGKGRGLPPLYLTSGYGPDECYYARYCYYRLACGLSVSVQK